MPKKSQVPWPEIVISTAKNLRSVSNTGPMLMAIPLWSGISRTSDGNVLMCGVQGVDAMRLDGQH